MGGRLICLRMAPPDGTTVRLGGFDPGAVSAYFVHSYHCKPDDESTILAETVYGGRRLTAAIVQDNFIGFQFHPERSGEVGQSVLKRFMNL